MSRNTAMSLVAQFLGRQNTIPVPVPFVRMLGDYESAALLAQCLYWGDRTDDADGWFYKTHEEWSEELELSSDQVRRCVKTCNGMIEVKRKGIPARNYYRADKEVICQALEHLANENQSATTRNGETQRLKVEKPNDSALETSTTSRTETPTTNTKPTSEPTQSLQTKKRESEQPHLEAEALPPVAPALTQKIEQTEQIEQRNPVITASGLSQVQANARHSTGPKSWEVAGAAAAGGPENSADHFRDTGELLNRVFGARVITDMIGNPASLADRKRWYAVPLERALELLGQAKTEARRSGYTPQTVLKKLLDDEVMRGGLPSLPAPISESVPAVSKRQRFEVLQRVAYRGLVYKVFEVTDRKITLLGEDGFDFDVPLNGTDFATIRAVS